MTRGPVDDGPLVLAIDNGSQSTKVALVDAAGQVVASATARLIQGTGRKPRSVCTVLTRERRCRPGRGRRALSGP